MLTTEGLFARALRCWGTQQLIKLSCWGQTRVGLASLDHDMCSIKLHATGQTTLSNSAPYLSPHHYVLNLLGCTHSASVITSLLHVYSQYFYCLLLHKHNASPLAVPVSAACLYIISQSSSHTPLFFTLPPSFLSCFCDLGILSASFGCCCLFSVSRWECLAPRHPQGNLQRRRESAKDRAKEEKLSGGTESSNSQGPVAVGADSGAAVDLQRQFWG